jgi:hypothetical protein
MSFSIMIDEEQECEFNFTSADYMSAVVGNIYLICSSKEKEPLEQACNWIKERYPDKNVRIEGHGCVAKQE